MKAVDTNIEGLIEVIGKLQERMGRDKYRHDLLNNELFTRYVLIDPLLRALGWDTENPEEVRVEYRVTSKRRKRADYVLFRNKEAVALIEAKKFGWRGGKEPPIIKAARQVSGYQVSMSSVPLGIVTDGGGWWVYHLGTVGHLEDRRILMFDFKWDSKKIAVEAIRLATNRIGELIYQRSNYNGLQTRN